MAGVRAAVRGIGPSSVPVLIHGESGCGKEVLARLIHKRSAQHAGPFIKLSCATFDDAWLESDIAAHVRRAFNGARESLHDRADSGTLFLDEIAELGANLQAELPNLLHDGAFASFGRFAGERADLRLICSTSRVLEKQSGPGQFRSHMFHRLNVVLIALPPLRERVDDIPALAAHFLRLYSQEYDTGARMVSPNLLRLLTEYHWPGNIRELEDLMRRYVLLGSEKSLYQDLLSGTSAVSASDSRGPSPPTELKAITRDAVRQLERTTILRALEANHWNRRAAARDLNISYRGLFYKLKQAGIPAKRRPLSAPPKDDSN